MNNNIKDIFDTPRDKAINRDEFDTKLTSAINGLKLIHTALLNDDNGSINSVVLCDALEPFLNDLYSIEARYSNHMGFSGGSK